MRAEYIRIVSTLSIQPESSGEGLFRLAGTVENQGDEMAREVMLETVESAEIVTAMGDLRPGERREIEATLTGVQLGVLERGYHLVPFRAHYRDLNGVPFSAAFLIALLATGGDSRLARLSPVRIGIDPELSEDNGLPLSGEKQLDLTITNLSQQPVTVSVSLIGSRELLYQPPLFSDLELFPQERRNLSINVVNEAGLLGSTYESHILVKGTQEGIHFAEFSSLILRIVPARQEAYFVWALLAFALFFVAMGVAYWLRGRRSN